MRWSPRRTGHHAVGQGYGGENPIASNATPSGRAVNRRVSFMVTCPAQ